MLQNEFTPKEELKGNIAVLGIGLLVGGITYFIISIYDPEGSFLVSIACVALGIFLIGKGTGKTIKHLHGLITPGKNKSARKRKRKRRNDILDDNFN